MCISTAYEHDVHGAVLAEYVASISQENKTVILTDIMGKKIRVPGFLISADLTNGVLVIETMPQESGTPGSVPPARKNEE